MSLKIYTKTGDSGKTSLLGGTKVSKSDIRIQAYGDVDELNSFIGLLGDQYPESATQAVLKEIQDRLFTIGSTLSCDPRKEIALSIPDLLETDVQLLEKEIDRLSGLLPVMKSFILPGGHVVVSLAHVCRCVCRRAERVTVQLDTEEPIGQPLVLMYLNRLSDYLFMLARYAGHLLGIAEIPWKPRK